MTAAPGALYAYFRMCLPLGELARRDGFEVTFADAGDDGHPPSVTLADLAGHDVIVAQRWNKHDGLGVWRRARTPYSRLVFELDDDLWHITAENWHAFQLYGRPDIRDAVEHSAQTADLITVSTPPLAEVLREVAGHDRVAVLPNCVPDWALELPRPRRERPRVGWQGGASHGIDIGEAAAPVRRFLQRFPGWDLQLNGQDYRETFAAPAGRMFHVPWIHVFRRPEAYFASIDFDIGLCPLYPTRFARSKSWLKPLEYAARGIPSVASDIEPYRALITHGENGFLVRRDHEWLLYLSMLARDEVLREKMGAAAREMARQHVISSGADAWEQAYLGMFGRGGSHGSTGN
jgi:glycosyltransferase involved in cell wall biosynthesis